jgi:uncharacterized membrane protein
MMTVLHVFFGTLALVVAPAAFAVRKGGVWHRRCGLAFVLAMAIVLFSAGFLWQAKGHEFLVPLGAVSGYLIFSGYRAVARKRRPQPDPIEDRIDMLAAGAALLAAAGVAYLAATAVTPLMLSLRPALTGIAAIGIAFAANDILGFRSPRMPRGWLLSHFAGMIAAYVSAVTAFAVINAHAVPMLLRWAVPSAVGGALIVGVTLRYVRLRLGRRRPAQPASEPVATATARRHRFVLH